MCVKGTVVSVGDWCSDTGFPLVAVSFEDGSSLMVFPEMIIPVEQDYPPLPPLTERGDGTSMDDRYAFMVWVALTGIGASPMWLHAFVPPFRRWVDADWNRRGQWCKWFGLTCIGCALCVWGYWS